MPTLPRTGDGGNGRAGEQEALAADQEVPEGKVAGQEDWADAEASADVALAVAGGWGAVAVVAAEPADACPGSSTGHGDRRQTRRSCWHHCRCHTRHRPRTARSVRPLCTWVGCVAPSGIHPRGCCPRARGIARTARQHRTRGGHTCSTAHTEQVGSPAEPVAPAAKMVVTAVTVGARVATAAMAPRVARWAAMAEARVGRR
mmetsp:Transcript_24863/g.63320  ORF Transcript_24863/g.63320 Transcript_24863/m.63320 type:complete len:202 (+) Transcript_24863:342-947(+)